MAQRPRTSPKTMLTIHVKMPADFSARLDAVAKDAAKRAVRKAAESVYADMAPMLEYSKAMYALTAARPLIDPPKWRSAAR